MLVEKYNNTHHKTNQETSHDELERYFSSQYQTEFVSMAGHEMKTSIQAILTYAELLQNKSDRNREDYVKAILRNASRLKMLSNNLTDFTKMDADTLRLKKDRFDLGTLILSLVEDFRNMSRYQESKIKMTVQSQKHVFVNADSERLAQVVLNLLDNATKFTKNGDISIKVDKRHDANYTLVTMTDTGPGIDNNVKPNLFSKFTTSSHSGTGLGLYICKNIIEAHGGTIWAENNDKGGATFSFKIPINDSNTNYTKFLNSRIEV